MPLARSITPGVVSALQSFRVVAITGPRQSGKTTVAKEVAKVTATKRFFVTLDDLTALSAARSDPQGFVRNLPLPVTIDEYQRAPDLLLAIKKVVDSRLTRGAFLLTGSAEPQAVRGIRETLAGRVALLPLRPLTWAERLRRPQHNPLALLQSCESARDVAHVFSAGPSTKLDREVRLGGFPEPCLRMTAAQRASWHEQYLHTYLERDVPQLIQIGDIGAFLRFVRLAAACTGQLFNLSRIAGDAGIAVDTARRWLSLMQTTYMVGQLEPYWRNVRKRLVKSPKLHFVDPATVMSLLGVTDWKQLHSLNLVGPLVETWVHHHLVTFAAMLSPRPAVNFFRSSVGEECDFVIAGARLLPIEVKTTQTPSARDTSGLRTFVELFPDQAPFGILLYPGDEVIPLSERIVALPMSSFLAGEGRG